MQYKTLNKIKSSSKRVSSRLSDESLEIINCIKSNDYSVVSYGDQAFMVHRSGRKKVVSLPLLTSLVNSKILEINVLDRKNYYVLAH